MQRTYRPKHFNKKEPAVEDLREKLNRKRQEQSLNNEEKTTKPPPPDPSYNFLRDPLRGDEAIGPVSDKRPGRKYHYNVSDVKHETRGTEGNDSLKAEDRKPERNYSPKFEKRNYSPKFEKRNYSPKFEKRNYSPKFEKQGPPKDQRHNFHPTQDYYRRPRDFQHHDLPSRHNLAKEQNILKEHNLSKEPPVNIKVEVSTSGERKCTLDTTKTVEVPVSEQKTPHKSQFRKHPPRDPKRFYKNKHTHNSENQVSESRSQEIPENKAEIPVARTENENNNSDKQNSKSITVESDTQCSQNDDNTKNDNIADNNKNKKVDENKKRNNEKDNRLETDAQNAEAN